MKYIFIKVRNKLNLYIKLHPFVHIYFMFNNIRFSLLCNKIPIYIKCNSSKIDRNKTPCKFSVLFFLWVDI